jgi:hypothetical protein
MENLGDFADFVVFRDGFVTEVSGIGHGRQAC